MEDTAAALLSHATSRANERTTKDRVKSQVLTKLRKLKKPANLGAVATTVATQFIPIPGVGSFVGWAEDKIASKLRDMHQKKRQAGAQTDYESLKFDIKQFDVKQLDLARHKAKHNKDLYNGMGAQQGPPCVKAYNTAYRFYRVENRLGKLDVLASTMMEIAQDIKTWCDAERANLNEEDMAENVMNFLTGGQHQTCGKKCFQGDRANKVATTMNAEMLVYQVISQMEQPSE